MKRGILALLTAVFMAGFGAHAATEVFNLGFDGDIGGMTVVRNPVVPTDVAVDTWAPADKGWDETIDEEDGTPVAKLYVWNGSVRGLPIALSSGLTDGVEYTLSARARKENGGANQNVTIAVTQVDVGTGDYVMNNFYNDADKGFLPVTVNSGDTTVTNVLQETLALNGSWNSVSGSFVYDAALGSHVVVQLQGYDTGDVSGSMRIDDFILQDPRSATAELTLDPEDELAMTFSASDAVVTNDLSASYVEGLTATNLAITSVSVLNQSHSGAFGNTTSLPLTLNTPAPASEAISIEFDNSTAGLVEGATATGVVQVIWNDLSLASSFTSSVPVSATRLIGDESIIAAFDDTFTTADRKFPGVDAAISGGVGLNDNYGSTDTSYGSVLGAAPTSRNGIGASVNDPTVVVSITNTTPDTVVTFDSLNFDIGRRWTKAPNRVVVSTAGNIDNNASITNHYGFNEFFTDGDPYLADYDDFDIDLTGLLDRSLAYGESASFTLTVSDPIDTGNTNSILGIDNIALLGSVISPTLLVTDPADELALNIDDPVAVVTGAVAVSYIEASSMPTNVTVTAVDIVSQSHAGSFTSASTNLPLTLGSPAASEDVLVAFDNATAALNVGETANGTIEIVWNEVGSASSSTSSLPVSAMYLDVHPGNTIAIFDHTGENAWPRLGGLTAVLSGYHSHNNSRGSTDGTYGTLAGDARTDDGCVQGALNFPVISMAITNDTGYPCTFDSLHFDAARGWAKGPKTVTVSISGDVTANASLFTNPTDLPTTSGNPADYPDFDIDLTGLGDRTLAHGETALIEFTFSDGDAANSNAVSILDNIALLGSGVNGAVLSKVPGGWVSMGVSSYTETISELIQMAYTEGDAETNVVITGVTFAEETHSGAFSYSGSLPLELTTAEATNDIVTLEFDNTVANVAAGSYAYAVMEIAWNEKGVGTRTFEIDVYATRAADVPTDGVIALLDTEFLTADAAIDGVLARMGGEGSLQYAELGSEDGTYGSLATPAAPTGTSRWRFNGTELVATLSITNGSIGDIELSSLNFDIGRWYESGSDEFTLSVSGDVTDTPTLLVSSLSILGFQNQDFEDHDVDLSGLADHTLSAGESLTFTFTLTEKAGSEGYNVWIDNIALMGTIDQFGGWMGLNGLADPNGNPDGDSRDNFMEYATGGDPLTAESAAATWVDPTGVWFYHVHEERIDDGTLVFVVEERGNLISGSDWSDAGVDPVGESTPVGGFKSVTNRTVMGTMDFIRVKAHSID